jgi:hypothetical protein
VRVRISPGSRGEDVAVETVVGEIDLASYEPFSPRGIPVEDFVPLLEPVEFAGHAAPEFVGIGDRFLVEVLVFFEALDVGVAAEFRWGIEFSIFLKNGINAAGLEIG